MIVTEIVLIVIIILQTLATIIAAVVVELIAADLLSNGPKWHIVLKIVAVVVVS
jgi:hypothetical protein